MNEKLTMKQHDDGIITIEGTRKEQGAVWLSRVNTAGIYRLDTDRPGLYVVHLQAYITKELREKIRREIEETIGEFAKGSKVLVLGPEVDQVVVRDQRT